MMKYDKWWDTPKIDLVAGVFEGGGAKGWAYLGAMEAMIEEGFWFNAVAGSSAGAMTALAIAAGLKPSEIKEKTGDIFKSIKPSIIGGLWNMKNGDGYFRKDKLRALLEEIAGSPWDGKNSESVTFEILFATTGIELNIVCADISQNRLVLFNHRSTPQCQVVEAALASSSIPFAFKSSVLTVSDNETIWNHTIVDGGVSANFPIFVFNDKAFREYWNFKEINPPKRIVAFLLREEGQEEKEETILSLYNRSYFNKVEKHPNSIIGVLSSIRDFFQGVKNIPYKNRVENSISQSESELPGKFKRHFNLLIGGLLTLIFGIHNMFIRVLNPSIAPVNRLRWRPSNKAWVNLLVDSFNRVLGFAAFWLWTIGLIMLLFIGSYELVEKYIWPHYQSDPSEWIWLVISLLIFTFCVFGSFTLLANRYLLIPSRRLLYGLGNTYVTGSFATPWVADKEWVISLPVPNELGTLSFNVEEAIKDKAIENAKKATKEKLEKLNLKTQE